MEATHPLIERRELVRVNACAPVPRIATSRVSLPRPFYCSSSYCQTRRSRTSTPTRRGNLNLNLDLTRTAIPCPYLNSHSVSLNLCAAIAMSTPTGSRVHFRHQKGSCTARFAECYVSGSRKGRQDSHAGVQTVQAGGGPGGGTRRRCWNVAGAPSRTRYLVPDIDKTFDIEAKPSISVYPDIIPISCTTSKF